MHRFAALLLCLLTLAGCSAFSNTFDSLDVTPSDRPATEDEADQVAEIVWTKYQGAFDELRIAINGEPSLTATSAELTERFGERPPGLTTAEDSGANFAVVIVVTVVAAALLTGLVVLIWWRGRKPPPPVAPPYPQPQYPHHLPPPQ